MRLAARPCRARSGTRRPCCARREARPARVASTPPTSPLQRETELRDAARILGVRHVRLLGHRDSGMTGDPAPGTLAAADPEVVVAEIGAVLDELRPDVVVTLDASDGHRDHAVIRDATLAAVGSAEHKPAATYLWCLAHSSMTRWADHMRRRRRRRCLPRARRARHTRRRDHHRDRRVRTPPDALAGDPGAHEPGQPVRRPTRRSGSRVPRHRPATTRRRRGPARNAGVSESGI